MDLDGLVEKLKENVISIGTEGVMKYLSVQLPFTNWPVFKLLIKTVVKMVFSIIVNETELGIYFIYTDVRVNGQVRSYVLAATKNDGIQKNPESTPEEKARAEEELLDAARVLVRLGA